MEFLLNASQMKQCDGDTIQKIGIPSMVLMERAALAVKEELFREKLDLSSVLVVCGSGNNGGDGLAVARLLDEAGVRVSVAFVGKEASMTEETRLQMKICRNCGIKPCSNFRDKEYTTIVDAIFGIGANRKIEGEYAKLIDWINQSRAFVAAVDIPSGVSADTGKILGTAVRADLTVTFAYRKLGQILYPGAEYCGKVIRRDIGITADGLRNAMPCAFTYQPEDLSRIAGRRPYSNKGTYGKVLLIAGSHCMGGAAYLAALAACRCGSGLVRIFTPECNRVILQTLIPEAVLTTYTSSEDCLEKLKVSLEWADTAGIGPGMGKNSQTEEILQYVLHHFSKPLVIDADGLNVLAERKHWLKETEAKVIITPHIGEMERLSGCPKSQIVESLVAAAGREASAWETVCVLKDARTVVSDGERYYINTSGNSGMAAGGSGDVLTGVLCSLLGQKMNPFDAASLGVYLHGLAGDLAARKFGEHGMTASHLARAVGDVLKGCTSHGETAAEKDFRVWENGRQGKENE